MAQVTFHGNTIQTSGDLPAVGERAPDFTLIDTDLKVQSLSELKGKKKVLNIFPSIDTPVCATSVRTFNAWAASQPDTVLINVSADLPFAHKRFCGAEGIEGSLSTSTFRGTFADDYGVRITEGPLTDLCARAVVVLDEDDRVIHAELVSDIGSEPNYDAVKALF